MGVIPKDILEHIEKEARVSLLNNPGFLSKFCGKSPIDIFSITPYKKLIFIWGNHETGLQHINIRHRFFSNEYTRCKGEYIITSRFGMESGTLMDYRRMADELYFEQNRVIEEPGRGKHYDVFMGRLPFMDNKEFKLVLHKNTKIVHTLYPNIPPHEKPKGKRFLRYDCQVEYQDETYARVVIPYLDIKERLVFGIGVRIDKTAHKETWSVLIYKNDTLFKKADNVADSSIFNSGYSIPYRIDQINKMDLTFIEDWVLEGIDKHSI
ncbi:MAG: hypothetical protein H7Y86_04535 [Rhizobacter sp.]|nr:hypothetical protein [Ferruginibacter sp.]